MGRLDRNLGITPSQAPQVQIQIQNQQANVPAANQLPPQVQSFKFNEPQFLVQGNTSPRLKQKDQAVRSNLKQNSVVNPHIPQNSLNQNTDVNPQTQQSKRMSQGIINDANASQKNIDPCSSQKMGLNGPQKTQNQLNKLKHPCPDCDKS